MPLRRDPETGLVSLPGVDPNNNPSYDDPVLGESRRAYVKLIEEENKLDRLIEMVSRSHNPIRNIETSFDDQLTFQEYDPSSDQNLRCPNAKDRPGVWVRMETFEVKTADPDSPFLNRLAYFCRQAEIRLRKQRMSQEQGNYGKNYASM
jgi:hypothetical protein